MGGYGEGFKQRGGQKEKMTTKREGKKRESGSSRCDGEREKRLNWKEKMGKSGRRGRFSVALHFGVTEFTVSH